MGDVVHNGPLVVKACPRTATSAHFEDDTAERPDIYRTEAAFVGAFDDFRGHVHGGARHGLLLCRNFREAGSACSSEWRFVGGLECFILAGNDLCSAEVDIFDDAIVVEEDIFRTK